MRESEDLIEKYKENVKARHKAWRLVSEVSTVGYFYFMYILFATEVTYPKRVFVSAMVLLALAVVANMYSVKCKSKLSMLEKES